MARYFVGESPIARFSQSRRQGEGQGRRREAGAEGSPIRKRGKQKPEPSERKKSEGIVGGPPAEGRNDERQRIMTKRDGNASDHLPTQAAAMPQDELAAGSSGQPEAIHTQALLAPVLGRGHLPR